MKVFNLFNTEQVLKESGENCPERPLSLKDAVMGEDLLFTNGDLDQNHNNY